MLHTHLTDHLALRYPIVGAPMAGAAGGRLAHAISQAGGLGVIGINSSASVSFIETEATVARGEDDTRFGLGLMIWAVEQRPELLDAAIATRPFLLSLSFGSPAPYVERVHEAGIVLVTQVNTVEGALEAERAGVDIVIAQGTEAGGHTGRLATLPLLQEVCDAVRVPVLAAGGIASPRGLAAVLAGGAEGAWIGTAFLACREADHNEEARRRILAARDTDTVLTYAFDRVQGLAWPRAFPGRALQNQFSDQWHERSDELIGDEATAAQYRKARAGGNHEVAVIYAGQAVGMVNQTRSAAEVVQEIGDGAEVLLRRRERELLQPEDTVPA